MPHPATMFFVLTMVVVLLSWIFEIYGLSVTLPQTGEEIRVQSLLSPEGIRWLLRHMVTNFTGFAPLGMVIVAMFGIGVAQHSGFINACIRHGIRGKQDKDKIILWVILLGLLSNVVGDAGYIILLPIAATLFHSVGLHPVAGIITAYASVACGYSANIVLSTMDPLLARTTEEAAVAGGIEHGDTGPLCNYYFMFASTFLITAVAYWVTRRKLLPAMGTYEGSTHFDGYKPLSRKERRALTMAVIVGVIYVAIVLWSTFSSYGILRGVSGNLMRSPFIMGILFLLSLGAGLMGTVYGFSSGRYRTDADVIDGLAQPMKLLGVYFVIAFFAAQMFRIFALRQMPRHYGGQSALFCRVWQFAYPCSVYPVQCHDKPHHGIRHLQMDIYGFHLCSYICQNGGYARCGAMCFPHRRQCHQCHYSLFILYALSVDLYAAIR